MKKLWLFIVDSLILITFMGSAQAENRDAVDIVGPSPIHYRALDGVSISELDQQNQVLQRVARNGSASEVRNALLDTTLRTRQGLERIGKSPVDVLRQSDLEGPLNSKVHSPARQVSAPLASPEFISGCGQFLQSGHHYVLRSDLSAERTCLTINVNDVQIDCNDHVITSGVNYSAIQVYQARQVTLSSCQINPKAQWNAQPALQADGVQDFTVQGSTVSGVRLNSLNGGSITGNHILRSYQQRLSNHVDIENNNLDWAGGGTNFDMVLSLGSGSQNKVVGNKIDGGWDPVRDPNNLHGADDGIGLNDESNDLIQGNQIKNNWDLGIESGGALSGTTIRGNWISTSYNAAIGTGHQTSFGGLRPEDGNVVADNVAEQVRMLFDFSVGDETPTNPTVYFQNNIFKNNQLRSVAFNDLQNNPQPSSYFYFDSVPKTAGAGVQLSVGNNQFIQNDFGIAWPAPVFNPNSMIVDGGGNIVGPVTEMGYPLTTAFMVSHQSGPIQRSAGGSAGHR